MNDFCTIFFGGKNNEIYFDAYDKYCAIKWSQMNELISYCNMYEIIYSFATYHLFDLFLISFNHSLNKCRTPWVHGRSKKKYAHTRKCLCDKAQITL